MKAFDFAAKEYWAIYCREDEDGIHAPDLELILNVAQRAHEPDMEAVVKAQLKRADAAGSDESLRVAGVAQIDLIGSVFRYANVFTQVSGGSSVERLRGQVKAALEDNSVRGILLNVDSPGGQIEGVSDLADLIYEGRSIKPIVAFSDGMAASAAYWLASAASSFVISDTASVGSIGVVATVTKDKRERPGIKEFEFVSSISPKKRIDPASAEGKSEIQAQVDDLGVIFVGKVAGYRGVSEDAVKADFGRGGLLIGEQAKASRMVDAVGTREHAISRLLKPAFTSKSTSFGGSAAKNTPTRRKSVENELTAEQQTAQANLINAARTEARIEGCTAERARIAAILASPEAEGREILARTMALESDLTPETAAKMLAAAPKAEPATASVDSEFAKQMAKVKNPKVGTDAGDDKTEQSEIDAQVNRILTAGK
jgi:ClpP class serine protease